LQIRLQAKGLRFVLSLFPKVKAPDNLLGVVDNVGNPMLILKTRMQFFVIGRIQTGADGLEVLFRLRQSLADFVGFLVISVKVCG